MHACDVTLSSCAVSDVARLDAVFAACMLACSRAGKHTLCEWRMQLQSRQLLVQRAPSDVQAPPSNFCVT
jgi:hypothetical protein